MDFERERAKSERESLTTIATAIIGHLAGMALSQAQCLVWADMFADTSPPVTDASISFMCATQGGSQTQTSHP